MMMNLVNKMNKIVCNDRLCKILLSLAVAACVQLEQASKLMGFRKSASVQGKDGDLASCIVAGMDAVGMDAV